MNHFQIIQCEDRDCTCSFCKPNSPMKIEDECICSEFNGKGFSTCGIPCPEHFKGDIEKYMIEREKALNQIKKLN